MSLMQLDERLREEQVVEYLQRHPEFFLRHQALLDQLAPGGRLVIPVGMAGEPQHLMLIVREDHGFSRRVLGTVRFVPLLNGPLA